ncbi:septal ring lytic transglycosylase RlpA family protein [Bradyrhizobium sp. AUGA SZCCT0240]|uniref:septal ring lytic transglycosylase RlpA family protein n=1 Tax=Bradyrhizobium sp. AUGA SZCCT0240 TaxID=2807669 RepID=UPI001BAB72BF|nr:septal ring lytic transglycosylase RlpA family protein [Bradyrhizobium sp. AUGA SZCCT0240]MBR1253357.1 septal ring lytic transglycosylase RlpA family protein [Bradyrhizobium sp. AUGA SZCCT0240]
MSIERAGISYVDIGTDRTLRWAHSPAAGKIIRLLAVAVAAASLAACQTSAVSQKSELRASRVASLDNERATSPMIKRRVAATRRYTRLAARRNGGEPKTTASHGVASFYTEGTKTASGERFNTMDMTAAHPTLPFGTKLRVTDVASGKSVTVRVNDVPGRVVDVSYSAADALGMVGKGLTNVKLDVVQ